MFEPYHSSLARAVTDDRLRKAAAARQRAAWNRAPSLPHQLHRAMITWLGQQTGRPHRYAKVARRV